MNLFAGSRPEVDRLRREIDDVHDLLSGVSSRVALLEAVIEAVPIGLIVAGPDRKILMRSAAARLGGHNDVLLEEAVEELLKVIVKGVAGERRLELFGPPPRVLTLRGVPLPNVGALVLIDDVSERVRLDAVRTDFVANISHELKTPVGALAILAETLADSDDHEVNQRLADKMVDEAHRVSSTIDDLLELTRIELGGPGDTEDVSLAAVLAEVVARHRLPAETAGISLEVGPTGGAAVIGDRLQLVSALSNLVDNAIKYTNRGGTVSIAVHTDAQFVSIDVSDTGIGIPVRDLDRVFERFYRVDRARSRETGGTGLGLAIVRHVANNHGGEVDVRSREGEGSTFTLRIPVEADK